MKAFFIFMSAAFAICVVLSRSDIGCANCDVGKDACLEGLVCTTCLEGYWAGLCRNQCPENCRACEKEPVRAGDGVWPSPILYHVCTKCVDGKYLGDTNETKTCDLNCPAECQTCTSLSNCSKCPMGYYLDTGKCIKCSPKCHTCLSVSDCTSCISGYYGNLCEEACSSGCQGNFCLINGTCTCKTEFDGEKCDQCSDTYFGQNCEFQCSSLCLNQLCREETGICERCVLERYGDFCNQTCSNGCKLGVCSREDGICFDGCLEPYSGDKCCVQNKHCMKCSSTTECATCVEGYYGMQCELNCSEMCKDGCLKVSGECRGCLSETYGMKCERNCSDACLSHKSYSSSCSQSQGECLFGCEDGFYGIFCQKKCNTTCSDYTCDRIQGLCMQMEGKEEVTSDDSVKNIVVAVVVTSVLSIALAFGTYWLVHNMRRRNTRGAKREVDEQTGDQTAEPYETLKSEQTNNRIDYDTIENRNNDYMNSRV